MMVPANAAGLVVLVGPSSVYVEGLNALTVALRTALTIVGANRLEIVYYRI